MNGALTTVFEVVRNTLARARRCGTALAHDCDGSTIVEFAFVAPPFLALLLATMNTALVYLVQEGLQTAAENAGRLILTGTAQTLTVTNAGSAGMSAADFKNAICNGISGTNSSGAAVTIAPMLPPMLTCSQLTVNVVRTSSYSAAGSVAPAFTYNSSGNLVSTGTSYSPTSNGAGQNQIVAVQLIYLWPTMTGLMGYNLSNQPNGNRMIVATYVVTTESYACSSSQSSC